MILLLHYNANEEMLEEKLLGWLLCKAKLKGGVAGKIAGGVAWL